MSDLKMKLENAGKKAEEQKAEKQSRAVKGIHLKEKIELLVNASGLEVVKNTTFIKVVGNGNKNKLLVAVKGGRVDLSGFTIDNPAVIQVSEEDAKAKHLGKVRGFVNFDADDAEVLAVVKLALDTLSIPAPVVEKPTHQIKTVRKVEASIEQRAEV